MTRFLPLCTYLPRRYGPYSSRCTIIVTDVSSRAGEVSDPVAPLAVVPRCARGHLLIGTSNPTRITGLAAAGRASCGPDRGCRSYPVPAGSADSATWGCAPNGMRGKRVRSGLRHADRNQLEKSARLIAKRYEAWYSRIPTDSGATRLLCKARG
jgi:hypothetical protein